MAPKKADEEKSWERQSQRLADGLKGLGGSDLGGKSVQRAFVSDVLRFAKEKDIAYRRGEGVKRGAFVLDLLRGVIPTLEVGRIYTTKEIIDRVQKIDPENYINRPSVRGAINNAERFGLYHVNWGLSLENGQVPRWMVPDVSKGNVDLNGEMDGRFPENIEAIIMEAANSVKSKGRKSREEVLGDVFQKAWRDTAAGLTEKGFIHSDGASSNELRDYVGRKVEDRVMEYFAHLLGKRLPVARIPGDDEWKLIYHPKRIIELSKIKKQKYWEKNQE